MTINELNILKNTFEKNNRIFRMYSLYLNEFSTMIGKELVDEISNECGSDERNTFVALLSEMLGVNSLDNEDDEAFEMEYISPSVTHLTQDMYLNDLYLKNIKVPKAKYGEWEFTELEYKAYEGFIWNEIQAFDDLKEIPSLAFFSEPFKFPAVLQNGREWMAIKPSEIETMKEPLNLVSGNVVTLGLGMGYFTYMASEKANVKSVTVIERDEKVIKLFSEYILPQFPNKDKVKIVNIDAFDYLDSLTALSNVDHIFCDIWHDASDGLPLYLKIKNYEDKLKNIEFSYWIEESLLSEIRTMIFRTAYSQFKEQGSINIAGKHIESIEELYKLLSSESLRNIAKKMKRADK